MLHRILIVINSIESVYILCYMHCDDDFDSFINNAKTKCLISDCIYYFLLIVSLDYYSHFQSKNAYFHKIKKTNAK